MRTAFIETLCGLAEHDKRLWLLSGDLGYSVLERFADRFPQRYVNVGVAEQNLSGVAAGLALCGKTVFTYSIANFPLLRCLEQVRNDICNHNLNVKIVSVGGGQAYGPAGYTHHAVEDLAVARALPHLTVVCPGDPIETRLATQAIAEYPGPCYLRLGKSQEPTVHSGTPEFKIGKAIVVQEGADLTLISTGGILSVAAHVAAELEREGISARLLSMHTVSPLDARAVQKAEEETSAIFTIEEHRAAGGLGSAVAEILAQTASRKVAFRSLTIKDESLHQVGDQTYLREESGLSASRILESIHASWPPITR
jgi:transketolase